MSSIWTSERRGPFNKLKIRETENFTCFSSSSAESVQKLWKMPFSENKGLLLIVHLNFLVLLWELVCGLASGRGRGLWKGSWGKAGRNGPWATVSVFYVLHSHQFLQCLRWDFLERLHVRLHLLQVSLELGPSVLEPGDDLRVGQTQLLCDLVSVGRWQVFLVQKALFQLVDLVVGEGRAGLPSFFGGLSLAEGVEMFTTYKWKERRVDFQEHMTGIMQAACVGHNSE